MTETTNYHFNQWIKSDRIRMEDFNADNEKLDAALEALKARLDALEAKNLWSVVAAARADGTSQQLDLSLSGVDLTQYAMLVPQVKLPSGITQVDLLVNGKKDSVYTYAKDFESLINQTINFLAQFRVDFSPVITFYAPHRGAAVMARTDYMYIFSDRNIDTSPYICRAPVKWESVTSFNLYNSSTSQNIPSGASLTLFGLKQ